MSQRLKALVDWLTQAKGERIMYFATYNGPSHSHWDLDRVEAFRSIADARKALILRTRTYGSRGSDYTTEYRRNNAGLYARWGVEYTDFLGGNEDYITLYRAHKKVDGQWGINSEPYARLTLGPRGGVVVEKF